MYRFSLMGASAAGQIQGSRSVYDLYDFFSMVLPGATLLLGLLPFAPSSISPSSVGMLFILVAIGYVVGRALHSAAESIDNLTGAPSHRDVFIRELSEQEPDILSPETVDAFYDAATSRFDSVAWEDNRTDANDHDLELLYVFTRSYLHIDGQGRSRTFQAVFAFYRSINLVVYFLGGAFILYGIIDSTGALEAFGAYVSHLETLGLPPLVMFLTGEIAIGITGMTFHDAKSDYRRYYIQYMISDFLIQDKNP